MKQAGIIGDFMGRWGQRWLAGMVLGVIPWVASATTVDQSISMPISAVVLGGPALSHTVYTQPLRADYPVMLSLSVNSPTDPIQEAALMYRRKGDTEFRAVPLQPPPGGKVGSYQGVAEIPALLVQGAAEIAAQSGGNSYEYYFNVVVELDRKALVFDWRPLGGETATFSTVLSVTKKVTETGGTVMMEDGLLPFGNSRLVVPSGAMTASSSVSLSLMVSGSASAAMGTSVGGRLPVTGLALQLKPNAVFQRPVSFYMSYKDLDNDGRVDGGGADETLLQPAWFDGLNWRALPRLGIDAAKNVVSFATGLTGYFALIPTNAAPSTYRPQEKIFSPNGDGVNDAAFFDGLPAGARIVILDVRGRVVREISDSNIWDGRDANGEPVESGMYLYQVHSDQDLLSGTLTVAR